MFLELGVPLDSRCHHPSRSQDGGMCLGLDLTVLKALNLAVCGFGRAGECFNGTARNGKDQSPTD